MLNAKAAESGAPPVIVSSIPAVLTDIRYTDSSNRTWRGGTLRAGEQITLRPEEEAPEITSRSSSRVLRAFEGEVANRPGFFCAHAQDGPFLETLSTIRWAKQNALYCGPLTIAP